MELPVRKAARVVLVDEHDCVLLFQYEDDQVVDVADPVGPVFWITPGGGLEEDETFEEAARRELFEETGIDAIAGTWVWTRERSFRFKGQDVLSHERFFFARVERREVNTDGHLEWEAKTYRGHRWWALDEMRATPEIIFPRGFADLLDPLIRGELPAAPVAIDG